MNKIENIEFIKWLVEKAEDFEYYEGDFIDDSYIETPCLKEMHQDEFDSDAWIKTYYPFLLQKAKETLETEIDNIVITKHEGGWMWDTLHNWRVWCNGSETVDNSFYSTADLAKEAALKYYFMQQLKKIIL